MAMAMGGDCTDKVVIHWCVLLLGLFHHKESDIFVCSLRKHIYHTNYCMIYIYYNTFIQYNFIQSSNQYNTI